MSNTPSNPPPSRGPRPGPYIDRSAPASAESTRGLTPENARAIAELKQQARMLRLLQDNLPVVVWAMDTEGVFTYHEGTGVQAAGMRPRENVGMKVVDVYGGTENTIESVERALRGEASHYLSTVSSMVWETWLVPVLDEQGRVGSAVGISLDVTEAKRTEQDLRDKLALIERQEAAIRLMSTPIIEVWDRVLTMPLLGVLDSGRGASVMERLLDEITRKRARFAVLDVTGVEAVDTSTANHLLKLVQAIRLLGAEGIITGIQPSVAQTMVSLGVDIGSIVTLATLRDGLRHCIARMRDTEPAQGEAKKLAPTPALPKRDRPARSKAEG